MGIKIGKVKDKNNLRVITTEDCDQGYNSEYICITENCLANMIFTRRHEKRLLDKVVEVPSFFRLKNGSKHIQDCPYDTRGAIEVICRDSDSNILKSLDNQKFEFSLQVLHNPENKTIENSIINSYLKNNSNGKKLNKNYNSSGSLSSYIKTLKQILLLRNKLEEDNNISETLLLNYRGTRIKWSCFYFSEKNYIDAFNLGILKKISYPICFEGVVKSVKEPTDKFNFYSIVLFSPYKEGLGDINEVPVVSIIMKPDDYVKTNIFSNKSLLIYGVPKFKQSDNNWISRRDNKKYKFLNISMWVENIKQIMILDE